MKRISVTVEDDLLKWLKDQVSEGRFSSISHGIRYALRELMKKEVK